MRKPREYVAKDGARTWRVRFRLHGRETSETFETRRAAEVFSSDIDRHGAAYAVSLLRQETGRDGAGPTVDELFVEFIRWKTPRVRSDRTIHDYKRDYANWIRPFFGSRTAAGVTPGDVQSWVESIHAGDSRARRRPLSPKSIADRHAILHATYAWASDPARMIVSSNPAIGTDLPRRRAGSPKGLQPGEWQALSSALRAISPDGADLAAFLLASGWRWSEATALSTFDVEDDGASIRVVMTRTVRRNAAGQYPIVEDSKSAAGQRRVQLDDETATMVRRRADSAPPGGLVFTTHTGAQWHYSNFRTRIWEPAVKAANLPRRPTVHWLRHTHVGWMVLTGAATLPEIQARIGHASIQTTINVYGRMIGDVQPTALTAFSALRDAQPRAVTAPRAELEP